VQHSGVTWGILTNGRLWRLVHKDSAHKLDRYYEVDLPSLLARDELGGDAPHAFLYSSAFFRRAAFDPGPLSLDTLLVALALQLAVPLSLPRGSFTSAFILAGAILISTARCRMWAIRSIPDPEEKLTWSGEVTVWFSRRPHCASVPRRQL
jgi:hypothetical protein